MDGYARLARPLLFRLDAERVHRATLALCRPSAVAHALASRYAFDAPCLAYSVAGLRLPNPVALPAGLDKNGIAVDALAALGFGAVEVGSVSALPSEGNRTRPRLLRLPEERALMVYYGVPNDGADAVAARLAQRRMRVPLGVSLVETNTNAGVAATLEQLTEELKTALARFKAIADYVVLNLSCPNTPGGAGAVEDPARLAELLAGIGRLEPLPPVFLKIKQPDDAGRIDAILAAVDAFGFVKGFIPNIHARRQGLPGGLTGALLFEPMNAAIEAWYARIDRRRHVLVGVGGISSADEAYRTMRLGASIVQVLTALVYHGPGLVRRIKRGLCDLLERDGVRHVGEVIGADARLA